MVEVLSMDIGGTNCRIARFDDAQIMVKRIQVLSQDINDITPLINNIKNQAKLCVIGFAGPITNQQAKLTNGTLQINAKTIEKKTCVKTVLINDFLAAGYGILSLKRKKKTLLQKGRSSSKVSVVIGPGTGLGISYIIDDEVYAAEAGHTLLAATSLEEYALLEYLKKNNKEGVYEDIISGRGLVAIYEHLCHSTNIAVNTKIHQLVHSETVRRAETITKYAKKDPISKMTLQIFTKFYARFAQTMALGPLCANVYLVGGITKAIEPLLKKDFMRYFLAHRSYNGVLRDMQVCILQNHDLGLLGAGYKARRMVTA